MPPHNEQLSIYPLGDNTMTNTDVTKLAKDGWRVTKSADGVNIARNERRYSVTGPENTIKTLITLLQKLTGEETPTKPAPKVDYYVLPNGLQVKDVAQYATSNGGQAIQYIMRACRIDGKVKDSPIEDIDKAIDFLMFERDRLTMEQAHNAARNS